MSLLRRSVFTSSAALVLAATNASATWSILIADTRTGEIVIASATCVETIDLRRETPVLITGVGAVTAQSAVDGTGFNRMLIRDRLLQGVPLESILDELAQVDTGHGNRQYGMITAQGETLTYSGILNANWAGGITGRIERGRPGPADDIVYTVQGNILSGPNVVQDAVDAIINTDSDLPGKLMAAMRAAQAGGGDGRCSCSNANPTGCGSPPPGPFKSAHVGYMLGTRADDIDSVRAFYPTNGLVGGMTLVDINHDSMPDVIVGDASIDEISIFINTAQAGDPLSHVMPLPVRSIGASGTVAMSTGDFNNDGLDDVAIASANPPTLSVMLGQASGTLADPISTTLSAIPTGLTTTNIGGTPSDKMAVSLGSTNTILYYALENNTFNAIDSASPPSSPSAILAADIVGNSDMDIIVALADTNTVWIGENRNKSGFVGVANIPTANEPLVLAVHDMNNDGDNEVIVLSGAGRRVEIFDEIAGAWIRTNEVVINRIGRGLAIGDFNGDSLPDIITTSSSPLRNLQVFLNDGAGGFDFDSIVKVGSGSRFLELVDMNDSGNLDLVIGQGGTNGLMLIDNPHGTRMDGPGLFAAGDYFLELNIANQRQANPDPVDQLADRFDTWRLGLENKIDAVQTDVIARHRLEANSPTLITIKLRDWQGNLLPVSDPGTWSLSTTAGIQTTTPTMLSPGIFQLTLTSGDQLGSEKMVIRVGDDAGQVRLMPDFEVTILENLADFNADGVLNFFDISLFLQAYFANELDADFDSSGSLDFIDVMAFISSYNG